MSLGKTGLTITALLLFSALPIYAQNLTHQGSQPTTGGLRVQFDAAGNLIQSVPEQVTTNPVLSPAALNSSAVVVKSPTAVAESNLPSDVAGAAQGQPGVGSVVRLNGLFHAASRARINSDGKLESDCHIEGNSGKHGGKHK